LDGWVFEPTLAQSHAKSARLWTNTLLKPTCLGEGRRVLAVPRLCSIPWRLPYNWRKFTENPQSGYPKNA